MTSEKMKAGVALVEKYLPKSELRFENATGFRVVVDIEDGPALGNLIRELDRFREREPLVQAALHDAKGYSQFLELHELVTKALDFELTEDKP